MQLFEQETIPLETLPLAEFRAHLRLGTGFSDDDLLTPILEPCLRAALARIERETGKALLSREFLMILPDWRAPDRQRLPVAPVEDIRGVVIVDRHGERAPVAADRFHLDLDAQCPAIAAYGTVLPTVPAGGRIEIAFFAGLGPTWADIPADIAQAVLMLAAALYDGRDGVTDTLPQGVEAMIATWRPVRLTGGAIR